MFNNLGKHRRADLPWGESAFYINAHWKGRRLSVSGEYTSRKYAMRAAFRMVMMGADTVMLIDWSNLPADDEE